MAEKKKRVYLTEEQRIERDAQRLERQRAQLKAKRAKEAVALVVQALNFRTTAETSLRKADGAWAKAVGLAVANELKLGELVRQELPSDLLQQFEEWAEKGRSKDLSEGSVD